MKKFVAILLVALMLMTCAFADVDASISYINEKGTFVLGLDDSFPPMGFRDEDNNIVGFDIDLAAAVCEVLGWELVPQSIDWASKEMELDGKNIDCIWNGMSITPEREAAMSMTRAYMNNQIVLVCRAEDEVTSLNDLAGKSVGTQNGSAAEALLAGEEYADFVAETEVLGYDEYLTAMMDLANGGLDGVLIDLVPAQYLMMNMGENDLVVVESLGDDLYGIGFRKEDAALRDLVEETLIELANNGTIAEICNTWFGEDIATVKDWE